MPTYEALHWDSNFFGFEVGKITGSCQQLQELYQIEKQLDKSNCQLCYLFSSSPIPIEILELARYSFSLVDKKVIFHKRLPSSEPLSSLESPTYNATDKKKLYKLTLQSGLYSRFKVDSNIPNKKFEELYTLWMDNSLNGQIAQVVLTHKIHNQIAGFITLSKNAQIGLIAVDKHFRGQGIGSLLIKKAEQQSIALKQQQLTVVTQGTNLPACALYKKMGFTLQSTQYIYHIWKKETHSPCKKKSL